MNNTTTLAIAPTRTAPTRTGEMLRVSFEPVSFDHQAKDSMAIENNSLVAYMRRDTVKEAVYVLIRNMGEISMGEITSRLGSGGIPEERAKAAVDKLVREALIEKRGFLSAKYRARR